MIFVAGGFISFSFNCTHSLILRLPLKLKKYLSLDSSNTGDFAPRQRYAHSECSSLP